MIGGAIAVFVWFFVSGNFKPQRFSIDVQGTKLLDKNLIHEGEILDILGTYEFDFDDKI